ncbi:uncharacterized protein MELLADRAFT_61858 [Melampsora larici-populina 98AG31]|uniref:Uncharacterized protein n=1 Tax=Melampsora larici-populina (strain 98AG31 / pathotype 3-4-7) TaxID=747676 RepID=F4RG50_MELLP|nr:uncharacterized protein MELLADRAFT_61858 [Melampsora larici-populina 98AG31]EGG08605.1 hypothetical protein MELLADRAFT_61858 [Melampsora larici-populina 98AG31]
MGDTTSSSISLTAAELEQKLSDFQLDDILSCTKIEPTLTLAKFKDVELDDLDDQIALKLNELKKRCPTFSQSQDSAPSNWILRQENVPNDDEATGKRRWLVTRNIENDVELSIDVSNPNVSSLLLLIKGTHVV